jgi:flagellar protein FliJ
VGNGVGDVFPRGRPWEDVPDPVSRRTSVQSPARAGAAADDGDVERLSPDFRLERVRALRERAEDLAREQYAASLQHQLRGEAMLRAAEAEVEGARDAHRAIVGRPLQGADLVALHGFRERTERARQDAAREAALRGAQLAGDRAALTTASRDREALERLKARHAEAWALQARRAEGAVNDELALQQHRRKGAA